MAHGQQKQLKLWYTAEWLPGYLIYPHKNNNKSMQKLILGLKGKENRNKNKSESLDFPIIQTSRFTLLKESDFKKLIELNADTQDFHRVDDQSLSEKAQAKLSYDLSKKRKTSQEKINEALDAIDNLSTYQATKKMLLKKYKDEELRPKKKEKKLITSQSVPRPFHYFGNSINYLESIQKILDSSKSFSQAHVVKDITCGSCSLTFYLAKKYPDKKYIASDINGEVINMLNYIKHTDIKQIEATYKDYHNSVFTLDPTAQESRYKELVKTFNMSSPKDYCLLIFLQNNAYTNVNFQKTGTVVAAMKKEKITHLTYWVDRIKECKKIMTNSNIEFTKLDMHEAISKAEKGDFYFLTPPHENDQDKLYVSYIDKEEMVRSLKSLHQLNVPHLLTYGNNTTKVASDLRNDAELHRFSYIIRGGMEKKPKKLSIYISSTVVTDSSQLNTLKSYYFTLASKVEKAARKKLNELETQKDKPGILKNIEFEKMNHQLATEISSDSGLFIDSRATPAPTENNSSPYTLPQLQHSDEMNTPLSNLPLASVKALLQQSFFSIPHHNGAQFKVGQTETQEFDTQSTSPEHHVMDLEGNQNKRKITGNEGGFKRQKLG